MANKKLKGVDERLMLFFIFILLAGLVIGGLFVLGPKKFTGYAVGPEGCNGNWTNTTADWANETTSCTNITYQSTDTTNCEQYISELINCNSCDVSITNISGGCVNGDRTVNQTYIYSNCSTSIIFLVNQSCTYCGDGATQTPNDNNVSEECDDGDSNDGDGCSSQCVTEYCGDSIVNNVDEECDDGNTVTEECEYGQTSCTVCDSSCNQVSGETSYCGDDTCDSEEDCDSCSDDCSCDSGYECDAGSCVQTSSSDEGSDETSGDGVTGSIVSSCVSNWECSEWSDCIDGMQTRECTDAHHCVTPTDTPATSLPCEGSKSQGTSETCSDGIKNQDEQGIDCGGVCEERCSFFTIMGNVVNVPVNSSKEFIKNNKAISFSLLGVIVLVVSWILVARFALKKKDVFFFLKDIHFPNDFNFFKRKEGKFE